MKKILIISVIILSIVLVVFAYQKSKSNDNHEMLIYSAQKTGTFYDLESLKPSYILSIQVSYN
jgi:uncharacterized protein YxeA